MRDPVVSQAVAVAGSDIPATQWHQDHITELPAGAVLLLSNEACRVQAFRLGATAYGFQFHAELDAQTFADWSDMADEALDRSGRDPRLAADEVRRAEPDLIAAWRPVARAWADLVWERAKDA
jgi:GMP synthase (glutamine-hydrolysing)